MKAAVFRTRMGYAGILGGSMTPCPGKVRSALHYMMIWCIIHFSERVENHESKLCCYDAHRLCPDRLIGPHNIAVVN